MNEKRIDEAYLDSLMDFGKLSDETATRDEPKAARPDADPNWLIDPAAWEGQPIPPREWIVPQYIPHPTVSLLYGDDGAVGKSLLALQLGVGRALAREWIGTLPEPGRTIYFSAEDDADEMHRRLDDIRRFYGATWAQIGEGLRLRDSVGADAVLCSWQQGLVKPSEVMLHLIQHIDAFQPEIIIIDTLADTYPGDENDRAQARQFIGMLKQVARTRRARRLKSCRSALSMNSR
jgi:RecA-family ATPase